MSTAGSPGRRQATSYEIELPTTFAQAARTSRTVAPVPEPKVIGPAHFGLKTLDDQLVRLSQVGSVHIIPHTTSVAGRIVIAINQHFWPTANCDLKDQRDQMTLVAASPRRNSASSSAPEALKYLSSV